MASLLNRTASASNISSLGRFVRKAFKMDDAAKAHLEDTFVKVHLNSRIWMV